VRGEAPGSRAVVAEVRDEAPGSRAVVAEVRPRAQSFIWCGLQWEGGSTNG
jgi:hypothetical protein